MIKVYLCQILQAPKNAKLNILPNKRAAQGDLNGGQWLDLGERGHGGGQLDLFGDQDLEMRKQMARRKDAKHENLQKNVSSMKP